MVVHITDMPIKCPVAPLEFTFLLDSYYRQKKIRKKFEIVYVTRWTARSQAGGVPGAGQHAPRPRHRTRDRLRDRGVDTEAREIVSFDDRRIPTTCWSRYR